MTKPTMTVSEIPLLHAKQDAIWAYDIQDKNRDLPERMGMSKRQVISWLVGDIEHYIQRAYTNKATSMKDVLNAISELYNSSLTEIGGSVDPETLAWSYPEDPTLYPIVVTRRLISDGTPSVELTIAVYECSVVYIRVNDETFITRID